MPLSLEQKVWQLREKIKDTQLVQDRQLQELKTLLTSLKESQTQLIDEPSLEVQETSNSGPKSISENESTGTGGMASTTPQISKKRLRRPILKVNQVDFSGAQTSNKSYLCNMTNQKEIELKKRELKSRQK